MKNKNAYHNYFVSQYRNISISIRTHKIIIPKFMDQLKSHVTVKCLFNKKKTVSAHYILHKYKSSSICSYKTLSSDVYPRIWENLNLSSGIAFAIGIVLRFEYAFNFTIARFSFPIKRKTKNNLRISQLFLYCKCI